MPGTGKALSTEAVANYIAKYATKTISAPGLPDRPVHSATDIAALACSQHYKQLIATTWALGKDPAVASLGLNRWTHMLGHRNIDFDGGTIHLHQQLQRVRGDLFLAPVKTQAGQRGLPLARRGRAGA